MTVPQPLITGSPVLRLPQTWLFQANPDRYRITDSLRVEVQEYWNLRQHPRDVAVGDRVLLWMCGSAAGIYAIGTVVTSPVRMADSVSGIQYWQNASEGRQLRPRVLVRYDQVFLNRPLYKTYLQADPILWNLKVLKCPRLTNYAVTEEEWRAIREWLAL